MSLPPVGTPIMVTTTKNGKTGKFIGIYSREEGRFVLRPLPGKLYIQQFPMYRNQEHGLDYYRPCDEADEEFEKEGIVPDQIRVDVWGADHLKFPLDNHHPNSFTWESLKPETIPADKTPDAIKAMVRKDHSSLKYIPQDDGLTAEVVIDLMNENGLWLSHVQDEFKTQEICLAAVRQTIDAFQFVPREIKMRYPVFYEMVVDHDPEFILHIPPTKLTKELIARALDKNPNIIYSESIKSKIKQIIPDYGNSPEDDPNPIPPSLSRQLSETHTNQGNQGTCGRHAFSRVIVKNFFELILPFQTHRDQEKDCNRFLETDKFETSRLFIKGLTPQKCSRNGYLKILLFLHCYFLYQKHVPCRTGGLQPLQESHIYEHLYTSINFPYLTADQYYDLNNALFTLRNAQKKYRISLVTFHFFGTDLTMENIKKITDRGLYILLGIKQRAEGIHAKHAVIIVGAFDEYMLIKNSWNDGSIYKIKFGYPFYLHKYLYEPYICSFVIPVEHPQNEAFQDLTHLDEYLQKYDELKSRFNKITVTIIDKSCPSKNKEPVKCDEVNTFESQVFKFLPSENPRCEEEAKTKLKKLNDLCFGKPSKPKLLLKAGKSKGNRKTRSKRTRRFK
jgi:hypothetical protein